MIVDPGLNLTQRVINKQALTKGWRTDALYCLRRARLEIDEMEQAIIELDNLDALISSCTDFRCFDKWTNYHKEAQNKIAREGIDVWYFIVQAMFDKAKPVKPSVAFDFVYNNNWENLKKTELPDGTPVLR